MNPTRKTISITLLLVVVNFFFLSIAVNAQGVTHFNKLSNLSGDATLFTTSSIEEASRELDSLAFAMQGNHAFNIAGVDLLPIAGYFQPEDANSKAYSNYLTVLNQGEGEFIAFFVDYDEEGKRIPSLEFSMPRGGSFDTIPELNRIAIENRLRTTFQLYANTQVDYAVYQTLKHCFRLFSGDEAVGFDLRELGFAKLTHEEDADFPVLTQGNVAPLNNHIQLGLYDYSGLYLNATGLGASVVNLSDLQSYQTAVYFSSNHDATSTDMVNVVANTFGQESEPFSLWLFYEWTSEDEYVIWAKSHTNISKEDALDFLVQYFDTENTQVNAFSAPKEEEVVKNKSLTIPAECAGKINTIPGLIGQFPGGRWQHGTDWTAFCIGAEMHPDGFTLNPIENLAQLHDGFIAGVVDGLAGTVSGICVLARGFWEVLRHDSSSPAWLLDLIIKTVQLESLSKAWEIKENERLQFYETMGQMITKITEEWDCVWGGIKAALIGFLDKLNPATGLYSTAYIHGLIAFEIIMEVITGGTSSVATLGSRIANLGRNAAEILLKPDNWGSHLDTFAARFSTSVDDLSAKAVSCLSSIGHCFIGSTIVVMANGQIGAQPIELIEPMDLVASKVDSENSRLSFLEILNASTLVSAEQVYLDQFIELDEEVWLVGEFSANDDKLALKIVRPKEWFENLGATGIGQKALIQLPEMGIAHHFTLNKLTPLSASAQKQLSRTGAGQPVTATVQRTASLILGLVLPGDTIGVTPEHRLFSYDRQEYVPAGDLLPGEQLTTEDGVVQLSHIDTLFRQETTVYNLEVRKNHNFYVGKRKVLVHNDYGRAVLEKIRSLHKYNDGPHTVYKLDESTPPKPIVRADGTKEVDEFSTTVANMPESRYNQFLTELNIKPSGVVDNNARLVGSWGKIFDFPNLRTQVPVLKRLANKFGNALDDIRHLNEEFLSSSNVHLDLGGHNRYPDAVKISYEDIDYGGNTIQNLIQVEPSFGNPQAGYISYLDNFGQASTDLITVESAVINDFLYAQVNRTLKAQGQFIVEVPTDLGTNEYLRIANEIGGVFDGVVDIDRGINGMLRRATFTKN